MIPERNNRTFSWEVILNQKPDEFIFAQCAEGFGKGMSVEWMMWHNGVDKNINDKKEEYNKKHRNKGMSYRKE